MTDDLHFERLARDWLELGPVEAPADVVRAAFLEIDTTPQERDLRVPWSFPVMPTLARALVAAAMLVGLAAGGALFLQGSNNGLVPGPSSSPSASLPAPSASMSPAAPSMSPDGTATEPSQPDLPPLVERLVSRAVGVSFAYPTGWTDLGFDDATMSVGVRLERSNFTVGFVPLAANQTADQWIEAQLVPAADTDVPAERPRRHRHRRSRRHAHGEPLRDPGRTAAQSRGRRR